MTKYIRNNETITGRIHEEIVMMDIEKGKYFSLNPVATDIWELLEKPLTIENLCTKLVDQYEVDPQQCQIDTEQHLKEMITLGLISTV